MNRILIGVVAALVLALAGAGWYARKKAVEVTVLSVKVDALAGALRASQRIRKADTASLNQSRAALAALGKQKAIQDEALAKAITANPDWADQRVPDAVVDALGMRR